MVVWDSKTPAEFLVQEPLVKRSLLVPKTALVEVGARGELMTGSVLDRRARGHPAQQLPGRAVPDHRRASARALPAARNATIELLAAGMTVSQVGRRWHYTDPSHFSRSVKRTFGINPSDLVTTGR